MRDSLYLHLQELEGDGDILQLLRPEDGLLVVSGESLAGEDLEEGDELEAIAEVDLEGDSIQKVST